MNNKKTEKEKRLKKKHIWPSLVVFVFFSTLCVLLLGFFMQMFAQYIMVSKIAVMAEDIRRAGEMMQESLDWGRSVPQAAKELTAYLGEDSAVYIVDKYENEVAATGDSTPNFDYVTRISMGEEYMFVGDSEWQEGIDTLFGVRIEEIFDGAWNVNDEGNITSSEWLMQPLIHQRFWMWEPLRYGEEKYMVFVRCTLEIQRQDILYVVIFGIVTMAILMIPVCVLMISMIRAVVTQHKMIQLIYLDDVTGRKNWFCFKNVAGSILRRRSNRRKTFALVCLHMERYKNYCACYGVKEGDALLAETAGFLEARTEKDEVAARNEGADFGMLMSFSGESDEECRKLCRKRLRALLAELAGLRPDQKIHFHAGIYMIYQDAAENRRKERKLRSEIDFDQLYSYANAAQASTKCQDEHRIAYFDEELLEEQLWERKVEDSMELALKNEEFQVYLQPKYDPVSAKLVGAEALVRWISPKEGFVPPGRFIPIFEENGFITQLDDYMIARVAKLQAQWKIKGRKAVPISVNVSRAHFAQEGLAEHICQIIDSYGPRHEMVELEVTESAFFDDKDALVDTVKQLKRFGFKVSMDDFGAGYSSLNSLKDIPLDILKLDGEFFRGEDDEGRGAIIVREAIHLAKSLNMRVVAEGVEKKEQVDFLAEQGCDMIQGFYFAKPMPVAEFEEKMERDA